MHQAYGSRDLSRQLSLKIAGIYEESVGSLAPHLRAVGIDCASASLLAGGAVGISTEMLRRLTAPLVGTIATELNRIDGREPIRPADWRVALYCVGGARTLREAIARCTECFEAIDGRLGRMTLRTSSHIAELQLDSMRVNRTVAACVIDFQGIANIHGLFGWLIAHSLPAAFLALNYDEAMFGSMGLPPLSMPVLLDGGWTGFAFPALYLDYPIVRAGDEVVDWPRHSFLFSGKDMETALTLAEATRRFAYKALREDHRLPPFEQIVRHLESSPATLRRRLAEEGMTYRAIKASCRRELGLELLRGSTLSIEQISDRLDFCDSDAFRSAFRDWVGLSPSRYRQELRDRNEVPQGGRS